MSRVNIEAELIKEEGLSLETYDDGLGNYTIGVGHLLKERSEPITLEQAGRLLKKDIMVAVEQCVKNIPCYGELDEVRQYVLISMMFNMGWNRLKTFKRFFIALENKAYSVAANEMLNSLWARQVKRRAERLAKMMRTGGIES